MPRALLLRCPVCDATRALRGDRDDHTETELLDAAAAHLRDHSLDESTRAIRKHETADTAEERILDTDEFATLPTEAWTQDVALVG